MDRFYKTEQKESNKPIKTRLWTNMISNFILRIIVIGIMLSLFWGWMVYLYQIQQVKKDLFIQLEKAGRSLMVGSVHPYQQN